MLKMLVTVVGVLAVLMGLLWVGQGLGIIMWPADSFMLQQNEWVYKGAILAAAGLLAIVLVRRGGSQGQ